MKTLPRVVFILSLVCILSINNNAFSQTSKELDPGYYVVVGAYAATRENIAQNYVDVLAREGVSAQYGFNANRNLFFVYVKYFDNLKSSLQDMQKTRKAGKFPDAWVRVVPGVVTAKNTTTPATSATTPANEKKTTALVDSARRISNAKDVLAEGAEVRGVSEDSVAEKMPRTSLGENEVFFSLFNARNNRIVDGDVDIVDAERSRNITKVKGNEYILLPDPKSKTGQLILICEAFGYRKVQQEINYPLPLADTVKPFIDLMGNTMVINFDLIRYHKGDIATLFNVYFFNDAAIMLPESKYELNSLLEMMKENPGYKIKLHGHSNGNYHGKVITMGESKNFFSLTDSRQGIGSAKDLARNRAEVIKEYLVAQGITADRMEVKSWGGRRPIYDRNGVNAKKNVRVEVEILEE